MRRPTPAQAEALSDYVYELETGDGKSHRGDRKHNDDGQDGQDQELRHSYGPRPRAQLTFSPSAVSAAIRWENERVREWAVHGKLAPDGRLLSAPGALAPWRLEDVRRLWPELGLLDALAALADLDGLVKRGFMDKYESIRKVMSAIAEEAFARLLSTPDGQSRIKEIADEAVAETFDVLAEKVKTPSGALRRGKAQRCSKCGESGHRKNTCAARSKPPTATGSAYEEPAPED